MAMNDRRAPLRPGEPAPDFALPAVNHEGNVTLADYRGRSPVLLAMMRGLYCAFCRRHIAQLGSVQRKLSPLGVDVLGIVAMKPERLRLYYRYRPIGVTLAADPELVTHRAYGVPQPPLTPEITEAVATKYSALGQSMQIPDRDQTGIRRVLCQRDGFEPDPAEQQHRRDWSQEHGAQLIGQFILDRYGIVRWVNIEGEGEGLAGLEQFPSDEEFLAAARQVVAP